MHVCPTGQAGLILIHSLISIAGKMENTWLNMVGFPKPNKQISKETPQPPSWYNNKQVLWCPHPGPRRSLRMGSQTSPAHTTLNTTILAHLPAPKPSMPPSCAALNLKQLTWLPGPSTVKSPRNPTWWTGNSGAICIHALHMVNECPP